MFKYIVLMRWKSMKKSMAGVVTVALLLLIATSVSAANSSIYLQQAQDKICSVLQTIYELLIYIAGGVGALVITIQGVTWVASADDAKVRKGAKTAVIHVLIGLIIVSLALVLVAMVLPDSAGCVQNWPGWPGP
jgi:hypothetical protein